MKLLSICTVLLNAGMLMKEDKLTQYMVKL